MNFHPFKILIVDDTPSNLDLLVDYFAKVNFEVFVAESGPSALERLRQLQPDLILLDILLPGMNGFEVCKVIKANPQTTHIPVIFLTARDETADKVKGFAVGGVDYITKPLVEAEVLARVRTHLHLAHTHRRLREENYKLQRQLAHQAAGQASQGEVAPIPTGNLGTLHLTLIGAFQLTVNGEERTSFRSDTVRALFAYLVLEARTPIERVDLAAFFWPDYLPATRLNSLRVALHNLRQLLTPLDDLLVTDRKQVVFRADPTRVWCDALALETGFFTDTPATNQPPTRAVTTAPSIFLDDFATVASAPFQNWRRQKQMVFTPTGLSTDV